VLENIHVEPDIIIADGQGIAHPRRLGLASHLGLLCDKPSIGCAKSKLIGMFREPGNEKGAWENLYDGDEIIGAALRTRTAVKPVFVSIGHGVSLESAVKVTLQCCSRYRITDPIRQAHRAAVMGLCEPS
jgi:deoxyribonuclease V